MRERGRERGGRGRKRKMSKLLYKEQTKLIKRVLHIGINFHQSHLISQFLLSIMEAFTFVNLMSMMTAAKLY